MIIIFSHSLVGLAYSNRVDKAHLIKLLLNSLSFLSKLLWLPKIHALASCSFNLGLFYIELELSFVIPIWTGICAIQHTHWSRIFQASIIWGLALFHMKKYIFIELFSCFLSTYIHLPQASDSSWMKSEI